MKTGLVAGALLAVLLFHVDAAGQFGFGSVFPVPGGSGSTVPAPTPANLWASDWYIVTSGTTVSGTSWLSTPFPGGSASFNVAPYNDADGALRIMFPPLANGSLNYLMTFSPYAVTASRFLYVTLSVVPTSGAPTLYAVTSWPEVCPYPAQARILMLSQTLGMFAEYGRWWSSTGVATLHPDGLALTITGDLTNPAAWTSVFGKPATYNAEAAAGFAETKAKASLGVTFGGSGCAYGHGVGVVNGGADFKIHRLWAE